MSLASTRIGFLARLVVGVLGSTCAAATTVADEPVGIPEASFVVPSQNPSQPAAIQFRPEAAAPSVAAHPVWMQAAAGSARTSNLVDGGSLHAPEMLSSRLVQPAPAPEGVMAPAPEPAREMLPIDLPTALTLAEGDNPQVAFAREQIRQAYAFVRAADALWLPSINAGLNYNKHEGAIQDTAGEVFNISRGGLYTGAGAGAVGAGSPAVPGLWMNFHLSDAIYRPLAARQFATAQSRAASATTNDILLQVAVAYLELLRAAQDVAIAEEVRRDAQELADLTADYARTGQGLPGDADRAAAELALRVNDVERTRVAHIVASARLAQLLRLDPAITLQPVEPSAVPLDLVPADQPLPELIGQALGQRPELSQARALVGQASALYQRERHAPFIPSIMMGASYGGFGGGDGRTIENYDGRMDFDAMAFWQLRNLGHGEYAARAAASSQVRQAQIQQVAIMDLVAREVVEEHARVDAFRRQIDVARRGVASAVESQRRNIDRIRGGAGLPIEVLQSIQALSSARREYLQTTTDFNGAQFALYRALGWRLSRVGIDTGQPPAPQDASQSR